VSTDKAKGETVKLCLVTIGLDRDTAQTIKQVAALEGVVLAQMEGYSLHPGQLQSLARTEPSRASVYVIDFDRDMRLAVQAAASVRQMHDARPTVIAVSEKSEPAMILEAMRAGCSECLFKPLTGGDLSKALAAVRNQLQETTRVRSSGRVLGFLGCRGGVGTTTLAVHLGAYLSSYSGRRVLIVDQQPGLGHVALYLGQDSATYDFYELVRNVSRLDQALLAGYVVHHPKGLHVLPSPNILNGATSGISPEAIERTIRFLAEVYEDVIVDCPRELNDLTLATIRCCDGLYLVATPDVAALRDLTRYIDRLVQCNVPASTVRVVINRYSPETPLRLEQIEKAVRQPISITLPNNSAELAKAVNSGVPVSAERRSEFATQMNKWAMSLAPSPLGKTAEEPKRRFSLWR